MSPALPQRATRIVEVHVRVDDAGQREQSAAVDLGIRRRRARLDERGDTSVADEDVPRVRAVGDHDRAPDREVHAYASSRLKSCAPSQSVSRPTSASLSFPSMTVAK